MTMKATGHEELSPFAIPLFGSWFQLTNTKATTMVTLHRDNCNPEATFTVQVVDLNKKAQQFKKEHPEMAAKIAETLAKPPVLKISACGRIQVEVEWRYVRK